MKEPGKKKAETALRLPSSGLAEEILAELARAAAEEAEMPLDEMPLDEPAVETSAPDRLFSLVDRLTRRAGAQETVAPEKPEVWVTFEAAGETYGLPVSCVEEILRVTAITRLPYAPAPVRGITQLRGRVLPVVDLRVRLGLPAVPTGPHSRIVVVSSRGRILGLLVDAARQVLKLLPSTMEAPPPEVVSEKSDFILAVVRLESLLVILLDVDKALLLPERLEPDAAAMALS